MPTNTRDILPMLWRQITSPGIPSVPSLSAAEQTKLTWAKAIDSYAAVPKAYQDFFEPVFARGQAFPYTVLAPAREGYIDRETEKLVCDFGGEIVILERRGNSFAAQHYPLERISYVECMTVLLDSRIKISGLTQQGVPASCTIRFNSVTDYLLTPILKRIRLGIFDSGNASDALESGEFDHLTRLNFKFMNFANRSLLAGDRVIHFILQSEIRARVLKILGKTYYRLISPTHMSILTNRELITIRENEMRSGAGKYGGTWNYIPLNKILSLTLNQKDNDLLILSVQLPESARLDYLYQASAKQELDQLLGRFRELIG